MESNQHTNQHFLKGFREDTEKILKTNILSYWTQYSVDKEHGGFYGRISGTNILDAEADKGSILNARILWTFAAAYRAFGEAEYLETATRAKDYLIGNFYDQEFNGLFWSVDYLGKPKDTKNQIYALSFAIYGLSEYYLATSDNDALLVAKKLFNAIEQHSYDTVKGGYFEAFTRDWQAIADMRLSDKDANEKKTMNTHLHVLEAYTNLYRVWKDEKLAARIQELIVLFLEKILDPKSHHLMLFFDEDWTSKAPIISYGHDIEASWLIHEAAIVLDDSDLLQRVIATVPAIVKAATEGLQTDGSLIYEYNAATNELDEDRHWWVQAEALVGYFNLFEHFGDPSALEQVKKVWNYIQTQLIDHTHGEWYWSIRADGSINTADDKAGFWKCPYHNGRMCLEILKRITH